MKSYVSCANDLATDGTRIKLKSIGLKNGSEESVVFVE
jgi:hypothetical protein